MVRAVVDWTCLLFFFKSKEASGIPGLVQARKPWPVIPWFWLTTRLLVDPSVTQVGIQLDARQCQDLGASNSHKESLTSVERSKTPLFIWPWVKNRVTPKWLALVNGTKETKTCGPVRFLVDYGRPNLRRAHGL